MPESVEVEPLAVVPQADTKHADARVPDPCKNIPVDRRLAPFKTKIWLGTAVIGSSHHHTIAEPRLATGCGGSARLRARLEGVLGGPTQSFEVANGYSTGATIAAEHTTPLELRFVPQSVGTHGATLHCDITWSDGAHESRTVQVSALGVDPHALPADRMRDKAPAPQPKPEVDVAGIDPNLMKKLGDAKNAAHRLAVNFNQKQILGVRTVGNEVATYKTKPAPGPWWADLAQLAITLGTAYVGGAVAARIAPHVGGWLAGMVAAGDDTAIVAGIGEAVQSGISEVAAKVLPSVPKGGSKSEGNKEDVLSSNKAIDFFAKQEDALIDAGTAYGKVIDETETRLQPVLRKNPDAAIRAMEGVATACQQSGDGDTSAIAKAQAFATSQKYTSGIARSVAGEDHVQDYKSGNTVRTTDFRNGYGTADGKPYARGLLRVAVEMVGAGDARTNPFKVTSAALDGLPQEIADRFAREDLSKAEVPMRIVVSSPMGKAWITRDEAGRIRVTGRLPLIGDAPTNANYHAGAASIFERLLAKPLQAWGMKNVNTDDESGRD